jgi:hypothetical protein
VIPQNSNVEDELAIRHLAASYTDAVNRLSPEDAAEVWMTDGVLIYFGKEIVGREKLLKGYTRTFGGFRSLFQMTHSGLVVVDGDRARARWWWSEIGQPLEGDETRLSFGTYQDDVVKTDAGWRFARRQLDYIENGTIDFTPAEGGPCTKPIWLAL